VRPSREKGFTSAFDKATLTLFRLTFMLRLFMSFEYSSSVSVIIAAYNSEATIERAVRSALAEPETANVVVVDDGSTDETLTQACESDDGSGRLKLIPCASNGGPAAARNRALQESLAGWISILDADDFFLAGRLKGLLRFANEADLIADDMWRVDERTVDGPRQLLLGDLLPSPRPVSFKEFVASNITDRRRQRGELGFIKPIMRRSFLEAHKLRYQEHMHLGEDYELYARALALGAKLLLVPAQGYVSVVRANSLSGCHSEEDLRNLRDCNRGLAALPRLNAEDKKALRRHYLNTDCRLQWRLLILAVKQRSLKQALATFLRPMPVPLYLLRQLLEQVILRVGRKLRPLPAERPLPRCTG
jgi:succinoglycan biosynthesis protein ExoU